MPVWLQWVRKLSRFCVAVLLWLNALFLFRVALPDLSPLANKLHLNLGEVAVLSLLAAFSVLLSYGWQYVIVDALYVYFFPFVLLYLVARFCISAISFLYRVFFPPEKCPVEAGAGASVIQVQATPPHQLPVLQTPTQHEHGEQFRGMLRRWLRPFLQFTLLWCLLLLLSSHRWLMYTALCVVLVHLLRTLFSVSVLAVFSIKGLSQLEDKIKTYAEGLIGRILAMPETSDPAEDLRQTWAAVTAFQVGIGLLKNRRRVVQLLVFLSTLVFLSVYLYLALLFAFGYYGLAKVQSIPYSWGQAIVTAIFIPAAFTDLPQNVWIKLLGGFQWLFAVLLGIGTIAGYLQRKLDSVYKAAESLGSRFQNEEVQKRMVVLDGKFKVVVPASKPPSGP